MLLRKITDKGPSLENSILAGAKGKIESFNSIGLHYNLVADAVYKKRTSLDSPFNKQYLQYIIAGLIAFDMGRMMGDNRSRYDIKAGSFAELLAQKLSKIRQRISHLTVSDLNLTNLDIEKERQRITYAYEVLAEGGIDGLNRREGGGDFHVGATKILHFLNPEAFLIIDSNAAKAFKSDHGIRFRNTTQPGYAADKYIACMKCAQQDILDCGVDNFHALEPETPMARIYDKLTFITGSDLS
jgi:hypothetical protein